MAQLRSYTCQPIAALSPGPQNVAFEGLITNITPFQTESRSMQAARGCLKLLIADESSEIIVKLWYSEKSYETIRLGQVVKVSTTHISPTVTSDMAADTIHCLPASIITSIFPEKDVNSGIEFLRDPEQHDTSLGMNIRRTNLTSLEGCVQSGAPPKLDVEVVVLVLDVGSPRTVTTRNKTSFQVVDVNVIDSSSLRTSPSVTLSTVCLSFDPPLFPSASTFVPGQTVLLISKPEVICPTSRNLKLTPQSRVFINPCIPETPLLRSWANRLLAIPPLSTLLGDGLVTQYSYRFSETIDKQARGEVARRQFTLASFLDEIDLRRQQAAKRRSYWRRFAKDPILVGYVSVIVTRISLVDLFQSNQLFHGTCPHCRITMAANTSTLSHLCSSRVDTPSNRTSSDPSNLESIKMTSAAKAHQMKLCWNNQLLCGIGDETGGLLLHEKEDRHNLLLTDCAVLGLTGLSRDDFEQIGSNPNDAIDGALYTNESDMEATRKREKMHRKLCWIEEQVLWARVTMTLGWANSCTGMRRRGAHESSRNRNDELQTGCDEESIVVLDVSS